MAKKVIKFGGWYIAYEVGSTALLIGLASYGLRFPGF